MKPLIIGITGGSGSGKTSFINGLKTAFSRDELCIISQDDYYKPREEQDRDHRNVVNFDLPTAIDHHRFLDDLISLSRGEVISREEYTFNNPAKTPGNLTFHPAPVIVIEGLFVLYYPKIRKRLDLKVFVAAKETLKIIRRIKRDQVERNYPLEDVLYRYQHHVMPAFERYIQPYASEADIIVNNNSVFEKGLQMIKGFIRNYLDELHREGGITYRLKEEE
mgnify:CR=1 FL=1